MRTFWNIQFFFDENYGNFSEMCTKEVHSSSLNSYNKKSYFNSKSFGFENIYFIVGFIGQSGILWTDKTYPMFIWLWQRCFYFFSTYFSCIFLWEILRAVNNHPNTRSSHAVTKGRPREQTSLELRRNVSNEPNP